MLLKPFALKGRVDAFELVDPCELLPTLLPKLQSVTSVSVAPLPPAVGPRAYLQATRFALRLARGRCLRSHGVPKLADMPRETSR